MNHAMQVQSLANVHDADRCYGPGETFEWKGTRSDAIFSHEQGRILILDPDFFADAPAPGKGDNSGLKLATLRKEKAALEAELNQAKLANEQARVWIEGIYTAFGVPMTDGEFDPHKEIEAMREELESFRSDEAVSLEVVSTDEVAAKLAEGSAPPAPIPTFKELKEQAKGLGIDLKFNASRVEIEGLVAAKLAEGVS